MQHSTQQHTNFRHCDRLLVIMAKAPRIGNVKSRLSPHLPPAAVVELYRCLLHDTVALARSLPAVEVAIMCPESDVEDLSRTLDHHVPVVAQTGFGLAAGLTSVFATFTADRRRVIAFNSDSPHLPGSVLLAAFGSLATADLVVGPTHDGGYYLVGATASHPELFASGGMGTTDALGALLARANELGLSLAFTDAFFDVDVETDLQRLATELRLAPARAPRTAAWLMKWKTAAENASSMGAV
jgi:rSAM/selenodomain-associated transferase 1